MQENNYSKEAADSMSSYTRKLNIRLKPILAIWAETGIIPDFSIGDISIKYIMDKLQTPFLPALFHMNNFLENPGLFEHFQKSHTIEKSIWDDLVKEPAHSRNLKIPMSLHIN